MSCWHLWLIHFKLPFILMLQTSTSLGSLVLYCSSVQSIMNDILTHLSVSQEFTIHQHDGDPKPKIDSELQCSLDVSQICL